MFWAYYRSWFRTSLFSNLPCTKLELLFFVAKQIPCYFRSKQGQSKGLGYLLGMALVNQVTVSILLFLWPFIAAIAVVFYGSGGYFRCLRFCLQHPDAVVFNQQFSAQEQQSVGFHVIPYVLFSTWKQQLDNNKQWDIDNKRDFASFCLAHDINHPQSLVEGDTLPEQCIVKPVDGVLGQGIFACDDPAQYLSDTNYLVQPRYRNHHSLSLLHNTNILATFRVLTYHPDANIDPLVQFRRPVVSDDSVVTDNSSARHSQVIYCHSDGRLDDSVSADDSGTWQLTNKDNHFSACVTDLPLGVSICQDIHQQHLSCLPVVGWDITKIEDGRWMVIEANLWPGFRWRAADDGAVKFVDYMLDTINTA